MQSICHFVRHKINSKVCKNINQKSFWLKYEKELLLNLTVSKKTWKILNRTTVRLGISQVVTLDIEICLHTYYIHSKYWTKDSKNWFSNGCKCLLFCAIKLRDDRTLLDWNIQNRSASIFFIGHKESWTKVVYFKIVETDFASPYIFIISESNFCLK